ncbi:MAG: hypothetical protein RLY87_1275 [Chloroflexota bacterium]
MRVRKGTHAPIDLPVRDCFVPCIGSFYSTRSVLATSPNCTARGGRVDLSGCDLNHSTLSSDNYAYAIFDSANLSYAVLRYSLFAFGSYVGTNFTCADMSYTDFTNADLSNATIICADLRGTSFMGANMTGATISGNIWGNTTCPDGMNSDLTVAETCEGHYRVATATPVATGTPTASATTVPTATLTSMPKTATRTKTATKHQQKHVQRHGLEPPQKQ